MNDYYSLSQEDSNAAIEYREYVESTHVAPEWYLIKRAFKDNPNMTTITIVPPSGTSVELAPLFDGWKAAGKVNSTCDFWVQKGLWTINGVDPAADGNKGIKIVFDSNGEWNVQ